MIQQFFNHLLPTIDQFSYIGYWLAFFAALIETTLVIGLLVPGSSFLLLLGALSATGHLEFSGILWFAVGGAVLGDNVNFWLGSRYGQHWTKNGVWFMQPEHFDKAHLFFNRHGARSIFLGRFVPGIKEVAPFVAGSVGMRRRSFFLWNVLGGLGWGLQWVGAGYLFGQSINLAQAWMTRAGLALFLALILWLLFYLAKRALLSNLPQIGLLLTSLFRSLQGNAFVQRWQRLHPRSSQFLKQRFDRSHFQGFTLTLLSLAFIYVLALSGGIVEDIITTDPIIAFDHATAELIAHFRSAAIIPIFIWITSLGIPQVVAVIILSSLFILWLTQRKWLILPLLVSTAGASLFTLLGKLAFHRPRPVEAVLVENSYSFPSGHATIAVALYGFIGYLLIRSASTLKARVNRFFFSLLAVILIGLSRIMLGVHYVSDVWAGFLVGTLWLIIGISLSEWLTSTGRIHWHAQSSPNRRRWSMFVVLLTLAALIVINLNWHPARFTPAQAISSEVHPPFNQFLIDHHLQYTETLLGKRSQPLSLMLIFENSQRLLQALQAAGWKRADKMSPSSLMKLIQQDTAYETAPLAAAFWNNRINDFALERPAAHGKTGKLQTLRLWKTPWRSQGKPLFVAVARDYDGIQFGLLHAIAPDVDASIRSVVDSLQQSGQIKTVESLKLVMPMIGSYLLGGSFFTEGAIKVVTQASGASGSGLEK